MNLIFAHAVSSGNTGEVRVWRSTGQDQGHSLTGTKKSKTSIPAM